MSVCRPCQVPSAWRHACNAQARWSALVSSPAAAGRSDRPISSPPEECDAESAARALRVGADGISEDRAGPARDGRAVLGERPEGVMLARVRRAPSYRAVVPQDLALPDVPRTRRDVAPATSCGAASPVGCRCGPRLVDLEVGAVMRAVRGRVGSWLTTVDLSASRRALSVMGLAILLCLASASCRAQLAMAGEKPLSILVMGDSYSAGNGAGAYFGAKSCRRSAKNYAREFERLVEVAPYIQRAFVENVACSGDTTAEFFASRSGRPPQLNAVNAGYDLVFLTIGGNDLKFKKIVQYCLIAKTRDGANCGPLLTQAEEALKDGALEQRMANILRSIQTRAGPLTRIVVLGYPYLEGDPSYRLRSGRGGSTFIEVGQRLREIEDVGDRVQERVASQLNVENSTSRFVFVKTKRLFGGPPTRELFAKKNNKNRWFIQPFVDAGAIDRDIWYHPNVAGWRSEARLLLKDPRVPKSPDVRFIQQLYTGDVDLRSLEKSSLPPEVEPGAIKFASGESWLVTRWTNWGADRAVGSGIYRNHQDPQITGTVTLSKPRQCGKYFLYTVMEAVYDQPSPNGFVPPAKISIEGSCY